MCEIDRDPKRGTVLHTCDIGKEAREEAATAAKRGTLVAAHCATEPEAWLLGRVLEEYWVARSSTRGNRGEKMVKGSPYLTLMKIQECVGGTHFFEELEGEEGEVRVPAENIICTAGDLQTHPKGVSRGSNGG